MATNTAQNPLLALLSAVIGQQGSRDINTGATTDTDESTVTDSTGKQTTSGSQSTTGTQTTKSDVDVSGLQDIFKRQAAGVTPEMLTALFTQGQRGLPALTNTYANAVGARSSNNQPLALSIQDLQTNLTNQAAQLNTQLLEDSANTAAKIAELTRNTTTTSSGNVTNTGTVNNTGTSTTDRAGTTTGTTTSTEDNTTSPNTDILKKLGIGAAGVSLLDTLLGGNGTTGGVNDLLALITGRGGSGSNPLTDMFSKLFSGSKGPDLGDMGNIDFGDFLSSLDDVGTDYGWATDIDIGSMMGEGGSGMEDIFAAFGWADGGKVTADKSTAKPAGDNAARLRILARMAQDPKGKALLQQFAARKQGRLSGSPAVGNTANPATQESGPGSAPNANAGDQVSPEGAAGINAIGHSIATGMLGMGLSTALAPLGMIGMIAAVLGKSQIGKAIPGKSLPAHLMGLLGNLGSSDDASNDAIGGHSISVDVGSLTPVDASSASVGTTSGEDAGNSGSGIGVGEGSGGGIGSSGDGSGDGGDGWADGVVNLQPKKNISDKQRVDPNGINDTVEGRLSVGETVIPADATAALGDEFFQHIIDRYHTPVDMQRAMGVR